MIKLAKFGEENSEKLRDVIRNNINMNVKDGDCYVFSSSPYIQKTIKATFPDAKLEIIPSDEQLYHDSYKVQSTMKLKKFRRVNSQLKDDDTILVIIRSHPREASEDKANEFVTYVAKNCYTQGEKDRLLLIVRMWLRDQLMTLKTEKKLEDKNGKQLEDNQVLIGGYKYLIEKPLDKSIKVKFNIKLGEAEAVIEVLNKRELTSTIDFINPSVRAEKHKQIKEKANKKRFENRTSKLAEEKTENKSEKKVEKKQEKKDEEKKPQQKRNQEKKNTRKEEPVEEIVIEVGEKPKSKNSKLIIDLSN